MGIVKELSIIEKDLFVEGTVTCKGRMIIRGVVKGSLNAEEAVIAKGGALYGEVEAIKLTVAGLFEGEMKKVEDLLVLSSGKCMGKIVCDNLTVERGGSLNADISCLTDDIDESDINYQKKASTKTHAK